MRCLFATIILTFVRIAECDILNAAGRECCPCVGAMRLLLVMLCFGPSSLLSLFSLDLGRHRCKSEDREALVPPITRGGPRLEHSSRGEVHEDTHKGSTNCSTTWIRAGPGDRFPSAAEFRSASVRFPIFSYLNSLSTPSSIIISHSTSPQPCRTLSS